MKRILAIIVLIFSLQSLTKADDIRDFQIEGMSIGDSLLNYFTEEEINNKEKLYWKKKYISIIFNYLPSFEVYDAVQFTYKTNDKEFKIYSKFPLNRSHKINYKFIEENYLRTR